jgi:hypothetical protein
MQRAQGNRRRAASRSTGRKNPVLQFVYFVLQAKADAFEHLHIFLPARGAAIVNQAVNPAMPFAQFFQS